MTDSQALAEQNIAKADAVHDLGQSGRVDTADLPYCRLALGDMLLDKNSPSPQDLEGASAYMNEGLKAITGNAVTSTSATTDPLDPTKKISYERTYAGVIYPQHYQSTSFQAILRSYREWEAAGKPGERPPGWVQYTGFRDQDSKAADLAAIASKGVDTTALAGVPVGSNAVLADPKSSYGSLSVTWDPDDYEIQPYEIYDNKNKGRNLRIICDFITKYLYPDRKTIDKGAFIFDADGGSIKKLFDSLTQISSELNPMVVADSAGTSVKQLGTSPYRNTFCFPFNRVGPDGQPMPAFDTLANVHTRNFVPNPAFSTEFYFVQSRDEAGQPIEYTEPTYRVFTLGFVIRNAQNPQAPFEIQAPFSEDGPKSGPSVPYLGSVIASIRKAYYSNPQNTPGMIQAFAGFDPQPTGTAMSVTSQLIQMMNYLAQSGMSTQHICMWVEQFAMDIKKCGDWEQIRSISASMKTCPSIIGTAMLCTGDFLCSAKARLEGETGLWHHEGDNDVEGWKLQLFRSPDLSDPNMQTAISIVDNARLSLPLLILSIKSGLLAVHERLGMLAEGTLAAVNQMKGKFPAPPSVQVNEQTPTLGAFQAQQFTDVFATLCLTSVCSKALRRKAALEPLVEIRSALANIPDVNAYLETTNNAISSFREALKSGQITQYVQMFGSQLEGWSGLAKAHGSAVDTIKSGLKDIGFPETMVDNIETDPNVDIDLNALTQLIVSPDVPVLIMNGEIPVLNPEWTCGSEFQYNYKWVDTVGATQGIINGNVLTKLQQIKERINAEATALQAAGWEVDETGSIPLGPMRKMASVINSAITTMTKLYSYYGWTKNKQGEWVQKRVKDDNKNYTKCVDYSTNLDKADYAMLAKQALLATFDIPPEITTRTHNNPAALEQLLVTINTTIDYVIQFSSGATDAIWLRVLPAMYNLIGIPMSGGAPLLEQIGGDPSPQEIMDGQVSALRSYLDGVIATAIGYCENTTCQLDYNAQQSPDRMIAAIESFSDITHASYDTARVAIAKGCLINPESGQLVFGPRVSNTAVIGRYFNEPIMRKIAQLFYLNVKVGDQDVPIYDLNNASAAIGQEQAQTTYRALLGKMYDDNGQEIPDVGGVDISELNNILPPKPDDDYAADMVKAILFMASLGAMLGPTFTTAAYTAYDSLYISNVDPSLPPTDTVFQNGEVADLDNMTANLPYVARALSKQFVLFPQPGMQISDTAYSSTQFLQSPLRQVLFQNNAMARWASMGRFKLWADDGFVAQITDEGDGAGQAELVQQQREEEGFKNAVLDMLLQGCDFIIDNDQYALDSINTKLSFGLANVPNLFFNADKIKNSLVTLETAQINVDADLAQSYQIAEQRGQMGAVQEQKQQEAMAVVQYNDEMMKKLLEFATAYMQYYKLPPEIEQDAAQAQHFVQLPQAQQYQAAPQMIASPQMIAVAGGANNKKRGSKNRRTKKRTRRAKTTRGKKPKPNIKGKKKTRGKRRAARSTRGRRSR